MVYKLGKPQHQSQHNNRGYYDHPFGLGSRHIHCMGKEGNIRIGHGLSACHIGGCILQQVAYTYGRDHDRHPRSLPEWPVGYPLDGEAQYHCKQYDQRKRHRYRQ